MISAIANISRSRIPTAVTTGIAIIVIGISSGMSQTGHGEVIVKYEKEWNEFLSTFGEGKDLATVRERLPSQVELIGYFATGGSGHREWVFRLDDFYELVIPTDTNDKISGKAWIQHRRKWMRYPDGRILGVR